MTNKPAKPESDQAYRIKNAGEFIMLFPTGNAFLYPTAEVAVQSASETDIKRWKEMGCELTPISQDEYLDLSEQSGVLGIK